MKQQTIPVPKKIRNILGKKLKMYFATREDTKVETTFYRNIQKKVRRDITIKVKIVTS